jgi:hypothetical protein
MGLGFKSARAYQSLSTKWQNLLYFALGADSYLCRRLIRSTTVS